MKKLLTQKKIKLIIIFVVSAIALLALWYKFAISVPSLEGGKTSVNLILFDESNQGVNTVVRIPKNDEEANKLIAILKDVSFYRKIIQSNRVKSYPNDTRQIGIYIYHSGKVAFLLKIDDTGRINIQPSASRQFNEYSIGFPGNRQETDLFSKLYSFYQYTLTSDQWENETIEK